MKRTGINADEWRAALREAESDRADKVPAGFLTAKQLGVKLGVQATQAACIGKALVAAHRAETRNFRIRTGYGLRSVAHYKLGKNRVTL